MVRLTKHLCTAPIKQIAQQATGIIRHRWMYWLTNLLSHLATSYEDTPCVPCISVGERYEEPLGGLVHITTATGQSQEGGEIWSRRGTEFADSSEVSLVFGKVDELQTTGLNEQLKCEQGRGDDQFHKIYSEQSAPYQKICRVIRDDDPKRRGYC